MLAISFDMDWAPENVVSYVVNILNDFKIRSTFFITNPIDFSVLKGHELGIHPFYKDYRRQEEVVKRFLNFLPNKKCIGTRSHGVHTNRALMSVYEKYNIKYDSSYVMLYQRGLKPFWYGTSNILEIPIFFCDDAHFLMSRDFTLRSLKLENGLFTFKFHPIHIFMNTDSASTYQRIRLYYKDFKKLEELRSNSLRRRGTETLFLSLLEYIEKHGIRTYTLAEINYKWRKKNRLRKH